MKFTYGVLLLVGVFAFSNAAARLNPIDAEKLFISNMIQPRAPNSNTYDCFEYYTPIFEEIRQEYQTSYQKCGTDFDDESSALERQAQGNQTLISDSAQSICDSMSDCSALEETLPFMDCYSSVGDGNIKALYALTNKAIDVAANVRAQERVLKNTLEACWNASTRANVEKSNKANQDLNLCFQNGVPTTPQPTTAPATEPTTAEPEEPTTAEPEEPTTAEPEESTTAEPEEPTTEVKGSEQEEDLSRIAGPVPRLLSVSEFKKLNKKYQH